MSALTLAFLVLVCVALAVNACVLAVGLLRVFVAWWKGGAPNGASATVRRGNTVRVPRFDLVHRMLTRDERDVFDRR